MANDLTPTSQPTGGTDISSSFGASANLETMLRKTMAERMGQSPLMQQRESAAQQLLTSNPRGREFLAQKVQETPLSPTQQSSIMASRRAADTVPLMTLNDLLGVQTGGIENIIKSAVDPYEKAMQYQRDLQLKAMDNASSGSSDQMSFLKTLYSALKPTASQENSKINAESGLRALQNIRKVMNNKGVLLKAALPFGVGRLGNEDVQKMQDSAREAYDVLMRTRTGAALNVSEEEFYKQYIPNWADTPTRKQEKTDALEALYNAAVQEGDNPVEILFGDLSRFSGMGGGNDWEIVQ